MDANLNKPHDTATTSRESYSQLLRDETLIKEKKIVYEAISKLGPITSRGLANVLNKERGNITRSLYDLCHEINPSIKVCFVKECPVTNRRVKWYALADWTEAKPEEKKLVINRKLIQIRLL